MKHFNLIQTKYFIIIIMGFFFINYPKILAQDNPSLLVFLIVILKILNPNLVLYLLQVFIDFWVL